MSLTAANDLMSIPSRMLEYLGVDPQMQVFLGIISMQPEFALGSAESVFAAEAELPLQMQPLQQQMARATATTSGLGNVAGGATTAEIALTKAEEYLGAGYREISPGVYRSSDGLRQFRMTTSDLTDPVQGPHVHFEAIDPNGRTIIENSHVGITNP
jgi:hypothetical protein